MKGEKMDGVFRLLQFGYQHFYLLAVEVRWQANACSTTIANPLGKLDDCAIRYAHALSSMLPCFRTPVSPSHRGANSNRHFQLRFARNISTRISLFDQRRLRLSKLLISAQRQRSKAGDVAINCAARQNNGPFAGLREAGIGRTCRIGGHTDDFTFRCTTSTPTPWTWRWGMPSLGRPYRSRTRFGCKFCFVPP
jgi:hypothetical protein